MKYDTARPYLASYVILRKNQRVAFVLRSGTDWMNGYYGLPSGKVEKDEPFIAAAIREAREEVGIKVSSGHIQHALTMYRKSPPELIDSLIWVDIFFEVDSWEGEPYNAEPKVHSELAWLDVDNLPESVVPNVAFAMRQIQQKNTYCEFGWES